jgi:transcription-repair coupling factor (superfamily II helicase)
MERKALALAIWEDPALADLPLRIEEGFLPAQVSGLASVHRALLCAGLHLRTKRPVLVICPDEAAAGNFAADLRSLLDEEVRVLPGRDLILHTAESASRQSEQDRLRVLDSLLHEEALVTVCTVSGLMLRTMTPEKLNDAALSIRAGESLPPEHVEAALLRCGYERAELVEGPGQFSRRGGILDIYSPSETQPVRLEFWGDEIDTMGRFDVDSQRRTENVESFRILPAAECLPALAEGGETAFLEALRAAAGRLARRRDTGGLLDSLREDIEKLENGLRLSDADRYMSLLYPKLATALDFVPRDALVFLDQPGRTGAMAEAYEKQTAEDIRPIVKSGVLPGGTSDFYFPWKEAAQALLDFPVVMADAISMGSAALEPRTVLGVRAKQLPSYGGSSETALEDVRRYLGQSFRVVVLAQDERRAGLLAGILEKNGVDVLRGLPAGSLPEKGRCVVTAGSLSAGLELTDISLAVLTDTQMLGGGLRRYKRKKALSGRERIGSTADLEVGDLVVHEQHGIGRFAGVFKIPVDGVEKDYMKISYAGTDSLYVPATQLDLVSKYIGASAEDAPVRLSRLGGTDWHRAKSRAKSAAKDLAAGLIKLYAERRNTPGHAFAPDSSWQTEFEEAFGYAETDDQLKCIEEIKRDMENEVPMDRLLCGDVGYGKTEVALRAVMKCILDGRQAAILVPTTVLAQQHYQTAVHRFFGFPVRIEVLSRFRSPTEVKKTLGGVREGGVDLLIGTHRLLQKDVQFKKLGLLVVDEEQRFGVSHKEKLKEMSRGVDVLTLSATPIPRTLNMALSGLRSMSTIEEPPQDRQPVQTFVLEHDWDMITDALRREILRGGQAYYLHNRVESIDRCASRLAKMLPGVNVAVAHGQMDEESLSEVMDRMASGEVQVLVCTTIIETGIDIPNVNTLVIEDADKLGLAQLHQIRGRVGRSSRRASAYLTFRRDKILSEIAEKRLSAIREFAEFNSGFQIAMRDLEIRGAGNLLGAEQSGHMMDVGYDMYLKLLEEAILEERGEKPPVRTECAADLSVTANIPERYVPSAGQRMDLYRRIALIRSEADADDLTDELIDRFGDPPSEVVTLVHVALLRGEASRAGIKDISQKGGALRFTLIDFDMARVSALYGSPEWKGRFRVEAANTPRLSLRLNSDKRIIDQARRFVAAWNALAPASSAS